MPSRPRPIGEFEFLEAVRRLVEGGGDRGRRRGVLVGIGDDCAVVAGGPRTLLTTDTQVEGVHFRRGWLTARELGARAFRVAVSDIAAMGGRPRYALLSLELPVARAGGFDATFAKALVAGVAREASRCGAALVGGNVSTGPALGVTVTVIGQARRRAVLRSGARAGDLVMVTGTFGGAGAAVQALRGGRATAAQSAAYRRPPLRVEFAAELAERGLLHAMVDVSDGLVQDLGHLCERSDVTIRLDPDAVPLHRTLRGRAEPDSSAVLARQGLKRALCSGDDYELAFTASPRHRDRIQAVARRHRCAVTVIGEVERGRGGVVDAAGRPLAGLAGGFDHLRPRR